MANQPDQTTKPVPNQNNDKTPARLYSAHLNPVHVSTAPSLLSGIAPKLALSSSEARNRRRHLEGRNTASPLDITGFKHLAMLVLVTGNVKVMWADWNQFGFWATLNNFGLGYHDLKMGLLVWSINALFMPISLVIERIAAKSVANLLLPSEANKEVANNETLNKEYVNGSTKNGSAKNGSLNDTSLADHEKEPKETEPQFIALMVTSFAQLCCSLLCLGGGSWLTWEFVHHPLVATFCEVNVIITFLKIVSFALTNRELCHARIHGLQLPEMYTTGPQYPNNLTLKNSVYYWSVPTLVYQPVYPMRPEVRWSRILPLLGELLTGLILSWILMMQMAMPVLQHLVANIGSWKIVLEDYLTLATISITIWVVGFVTLFQSMLNLVAEITRFADRTFYGDWWNAGSVGTFWRDWNRPISNYFRRHIYVPLRCAGVSQALASNAVFFISALLHELLFGVATHNFNGVAFMCMIVQPILIIVTMPLEKLRGHGTTVGNCVFWLSILFGQPVATVIYFLEWVARNPTKSTTSAWWNTSVYH